MKSNHNSFTILVILIVFLAFQTVGCGPSGSGTAPEATGGTGAAGSGDGDGETPGSVSISAGSTGIVADGASQTSITVTVEDTSGSSVADGTTVTFSTTAGDIDDVAAGTQTTVTATTTGGVATAMLTSPAIVGSATVTATVGGISKSTSVTFIPGRVASVVLTATPGNLTADGSSTSSIKAVVKDGNGNAVANGETISFNVTTGTGTLSGPTATTLNGSATVTYTASDTAGTETITAQATNGTTNTVAIALVTVSIRTASILSLSVSQTTVRSDNSDSAVVTATVLDEHRAVIEGIEVAFSVNGGRFSASSSITDADGKAQVTFSSGTMDPSNQVVTITATVEQLSSVQIPIQIVGSTLATSTDNNTITDDGTTTATLTITALNAGGTKLYDIPITLSATGTGDATLSPASGNTNVNGELQVVITGTSAGDVTIIATGLKTTISETYTVSPVGATFGITSPATDPYSIPTNTDLTIAVNAPAQDSVRFATTLGTLTGSADPGAVIVEPVTGGTASVTFNSNLAGIATLQIFDAGAIEPTAADSITIAVSAPTSEATQVALQASSTVIAPTIGDIINTVSLIVTVKNSSNQVVRGAAVAFNIENPTGGGETVSPVIVYTDNQGTGIATFTSGSLSSVSLGVRVTASVLGTDSTVNDTIAIVIGGTAGSVVVGEGTVMESTNSDTTYQLPMSVLVADSNGNPVSGAVVSLNAWPGAYATGYWVEIKNNECEPIGDRKEYPNEDINKNLTLDTSPTEDNDGDGQLTPPNSAAGTLPATVTTDQNGVAQFNLVYSKASAGWIKIEVTATVEVLGTETQSTYPFWSRYLIGDSCFLSSSPYNQTGQSISLTSSHSQLVADGTSQGMVRAVVTDSLGNPVSDGETVTFTTTAGDIDDTLDGIQTTFLTTTTNGVAIATLTSATSLGTTAITASYSTISGTISIDFTPGPAFAVSLSATPTQVPADGVSTSTINAQVTDINGNLVADGETITFTTAGSGTLSSQTATTINGVATITYTAAFTLETIAISATATNGPSDTVDITLIDVLVASISLNTGAFSIVADAESQVLITADVTDANFRDIVDGKQVRFTTTAGDIDSTQAESQASYLTATINGVATALLRSTTIVGRATVTVTADGVSQSTSVTFIPGPVSSILLTATPSALKANGSSTSTIRALVKDAHDNVVADGETITFNVVVPGTGTLSQQTATTFDGMASVTYTASTTNGTETIRAQATNGTEETVDIILSAALAVPTSLSLSLSQISVKTDNSDSTTVTATVLDASNAAVAGQSVSFSAPNGGKISAISAVTDSDGQASVIFSSGTVNPTNQVVQITATVAELSANIPVSVTGTLLTLATNNTTLPDDGANPATLTITVKDAGGQAPPLPEITAPDNIALTAVSLDGGAVSFTDCAAVPTVVTGGKTDVSGELEVCVEGANGGTVEVTAVGYGAEDTQEYTVSAVGAVFEIVAPTTDPVTLTADLNVGGNLTITVNAQSQNNVRFATTLGVWDGGSSSVITKPVAAGTVSAVLSSTQAGTATVQVFDAADSDNFDILTVTISSPAYNAAQLTLQADPSVVAKKTIATDEFSVNLIATVSTSPATGGQPVGDAPVAFAIINPTGGGEKISPAIAYTDSSGTASTSFTSGWKSSGAEGVTTMAWVVSQGTTGSLDGIISFNNADPDTITRSDGGDFAADGFEAGEEIRVQGSVSNDGTYTIATVTSTTIALIAADTLTAEDTAAAGTDVMIVVGLGTTGPLTNIISFADADPDMIVRADGGSFITDGFEVGGRIRVQGSVNNDGLYTIDGVAAGTLTLVTEDALAAEAAAAGTTTTLTTVATVNVVIGGTAGSVVIGRGTPFESENSTTTYDLPMSVLVADSNGNPVSGAVVSLSVWPSQYATGVWYNSDPDAGDIDFESYITSIVTNEDANENTILDANEDTNKDGELTPPNSAAGSIPTTVTTDDSGVANFNLTYLKESAVWIQDRIQATTIVLGTETTSSTEFWLPADLSEATSGALPHSAYFMTLILTAGAGNSVTADFPPLTGVEDTYSTTHARASFGGANGNTYTFTDDGISLAVGETYSDFVSVSGLAETDGPSGPDRVSARVEVDIVVEGGDSSGPVTVTVESVKLAATVTTGALADGVGYYEVTAQVLDSTGQPIGDQEVTFSSHDNSGLVTLDPPTATTGADGTATCTITDISTSDDTVNISAASGGVAAAEPIGLAFIGTETSTGVTVGSVKLAATTTTGAKADGTESYLITAQVLDTSGQPISGQAITFTASGNDGLVALNPPVTTTGADGTATCMVTDISTANDNVAIGASSDSVDAVGEIGLAFIGTETSTGIPVGSVTLAATSTTGAKADGTESYVITAQVLDTSGQPISEQAITFAAWADTGLAALNPPVTTTGADGTATCTVTDISTTDDDVTIKASSGGVDETSPITLTFVGFSGTVTATPAVVNVEASLDSINPTETTEITAIVYDASGGIISGIDILFTLDDPTLAFITSSSTTDGFGEATATLEARNAAGEVNVTATAGLVANDPPKKIIIFDVSAPNEIILTANPTSILVQGTSSISAEVLDSGSEVVPNGTSVLFEVANGIYGTITASALTNSGIATATFEALNQPGTATINVDSGSASNTVDVVILQAPASAIEFLSAEPQTISIGGSGGVETSIIKFVVKDSNDNPLEGITVSFKMVGPNGGEYIDPTDDGTPDEIDVSTNDQGVAQVTLHSGTVAGPVTISGTVDVSGTSMEVRSSVVSIGGGVLSAKRFSVASDILNLPGLMWNGREANITASLADRFGNYNVLKGTTVSFATEIGLAIDTSAITLDEDGVATVTVRTQGFAPEAVAPESWEEDLDTYINATYNYSPTGHPRDGLCSILVYAKGEEHFDDSNANGSYDLGEIFDDTTTDPFIDFNDNGTYDDSTSLDPEELYIDTEDTGVYDGSNGEWDANKHLFINLPLLITGSPVIRFDTGTFTVLNSGSQIIKVLVCDRNLNQLTPGSTVTITTDVGELVGNISREYADSNAVGPNEAGQRSLIEFVFFIQDGDAADTDPAEAGGITVMVEWEGMSFSSAIGGTVD